jgi:multidrug resistance protein, MATE family
VVNLHRTKTILTLALPITVGLASSFIMIFIDLAMVGSLGNEALAAIGLAGFSYTFILSFVLGIAPAVQGIVARRNGQDSKEPKCLPLNAGLLLVLIIGVPLSSACYFLTPIYFSMISSDPAVVAQGVGYLSSLFTAVIAVGMCEAFEGYWAGIAKTKVYMLNILFMNCLKVFLNYCLIFGNLGFPALGTMGAGIASAISIYAGAFMYFMVTFYCCRTEGFLSVKPPMSLIIRIFSIGLPENAREAFFSLGYIVFYWLVGKIGTVELAAMNILVRVAMVLTFFPMALGSTSATLVSTAVGKGDLADAVRWGWDTGKVGVIWISLLGLPLLFFPEWFLGLFLTDAKTISIATIPLQLTGALSGLTSLTFVFAYTLVSLGDGSRVLLVSFITQWLLFLPAVWLVGPYLHYGLLEIWIVQCTYAFVATLMIVGLWCDGRWKKIPFNVSY